MTMKNNTKSQERLMLHGNVSRNGYGNAIIGRYDGCFEEDIMRLMYDRVYHAKDLDAPVKFAPTLKMRKGQCMVPKRLAKYKLVEVPRIKYLH